MRLIILAMFIISANCWNFWKFLLGSELKVIESNLQTPEQLARDFGYRLDTHQVTSTTGHILTLHRIPRGRKTAQTRKYVLLIHHGFLGSSDMWFFRGAQKDLPYILADSGFDVWLANARGNVYSRKHKSLDPDKDAEYWQFNIHDLGYYDLPAMIDYILNLTNQKDLFFLSHSMGASAGLIMCSLKPEYNSKIRLFMALAPLTYITHNLSFIHKLVFSLIPFLGKLLLGNNIFELFPRRSKLTNFMEFLCGNQMPTQKICLSIMFLAVGVDYKQFNTTLFPQILKYYPSGTSVQLILNVVQYYLTGDFAQFDFGNETLNILHYNNTLPPKYDLSKVTAPISLHYGEGDFLVTEMDIDRLISKLPNVVGKFCVPYKNFNHLDFVFAIDSKPLLYDYLLKLLNKYR